MLRRVAAQPPGPLPTMIPKSSISRAVRFSLGLAGAVVVAFNLSRQTAATGGIEGRIFDAGRASISIRARITVEGTAQEMFTEEGATFA